MTEPASATGRYVAPPISAFFWAALWLLVAALGIIALISEWSRVFSLDLRGQRTEGFLLLTPILSVGAAILSLTIGIRRAPKYRAFCDRFRVEDRTALRHEELTGAPWRGPLILGIVFGAVSLAGIVLLAILLTRGTSLSGISVLLVLLMLFLMGAVALLRTGIERFMVNRPSA